MSSAEDAKRLLDGFGCFHDACLREMHLFTETSVDEKLSMACPGHLDTSARMLFQRQARDPSAVELELRAIESLAIQPTPDNADSIISGAEICVAGGIFTFASWCVGLPLRGEPNSTVQSVERGPVIHIVCGGLRWRDASSWMGAQLRYESGAP